MAGTATKNNNDSKSKAAGSLGSNIIGAIQGALESRKEKAKTKKFERDYIRARKNAEKKVAPWGFKEVEDRVLEPLQSADRDEPGKVSSDPQLRGEADGTAEAVLKKAVDAKYNLDVAFSVAWKLYSLSGAIKDPAVVQLLQQIIELDRMNVETLRRLQADIIAADSELGKLVSEKLDLEDTAQFKAGVHSGRSDLNDLSSVVRRLKNFSKSKLLKNPSAKMQGEVAGLIISFFEFVLKDPEEKKLGPILEVVVDLIDKTGLKEHKEIASKLSQLVRDARVDISTIERLESELPKLEAQAQAALESQLEERHDLLVQQMRKGYDFYVEKQNSELRVSAKQVSIGGQVLSLDNIARNPPLQGYVLGLAFGAIELSKDDPKSEKNGVMGAVLIDQLYDSCPAIRRNVFLSAIESAVTGAKSETVQQAVAGIVRRWKKKSN